MKSIELRTEHKQHQTLTPRLQQAVRLLQLSSLDFAQEVQAELGKNPFLEAIDEGDRPDTDVTSMPGAHQTSMLHTPEDAIEITQQARTAEEGAGNESQVRDSAPGEDFERDSWEMRGTGSHQSGTGEANALDIVPTELGLRQHLHTQLNVMHLSERDLIMSKVIVESLDDDGYLRESLQELRNVCDFKPLPTAKEMENALSLVQSLEPAGVGARTVAEALLLQIPQIECPRERALAFSAVDNHLDRLVKHDTCGLARELSCTPAEMEAVCNRIRRLNPRPGWSHGGAPAQYITPDVVVRRLRGEWRVTLSTSVVPKVRLNQLYADLFQQHRQSSRHAELATHLQDARWMVRNVQQRFATILQVSEAIIQRQKNFLDYGPLAMRPLALKEIADAVGLHESTVSRVTNNKYMATPGGVFELKYFFSRAMPTATGGTCSATAIRGVIQTMIDEERAHDPLSDAEIARRLARQGIAVARRTVTKYRQAMRIAAVDLRRRVA